MENAHMSNLRQEDVNVADELDWWADQEITPWEKDKTSGPTPELWATWESCHGVALRIAYVTMFQTKEKLAEIAAGYERSGEWDEFLDSFEYSAGFFREMAHTIESAQMRLLVGGAVYAKNPERFLPKKGEKPRLHVVSNRRHAN
jgi:hypothetical protein